MEQPRDRITPTQLTIVLISAILGIDGFAMPGMVVAAAGRDGWLSLLLGGGWLLVAAMSLAFLGGMFPRQSPINWLPKLMGKWPAKLFITLHCVFYLVMCAWSLRIFTDMIRIYLLPRTPTEVIMITFLISVAYLIVNGIDPLVRVTQVFFPFTLIPFLLLGIVIKGRMDFGEILPVMANGFLPVFKGLPPAIAVFVGWGIIMYLMQFLDKPKKGYKAVGIGVGFLLLFFLWSFILTLSHFGPVEMKYLLFPVIDFVREIEIANVLLEKLDLFLLTFWILTVFVTVAFTYYIPVLIGTQALGFRDNEGLVFLALPLIFLLARLPKGFKTTELIGVVIGYISLFFSLAVVLLLLLAWRKKRKGGIPN